MTWIQNIFKGSEFLNDSTGGDGAQRDCSGRGTDCEERFSIGHRRASERQKPYKYLHWIRGAVWRCSSGTSYRRLASLGAGSIPPGRMPTSNSASRVLDCEARRKPSFCGDYRAPPFPLPSPHLLNFLLPTAMPEAIIQLPVVKDLWTPTRAPTATCRLPTDVISTFLFFFILELCVKHCNSSFCTLTPLKVGLFFFTHFLLGEA